MPFPVKSLPKVMANYVTEGAEVIGCDPAYIALPLIAAVGRAIGNKRVIRLKRTWTEPPIIWAAVISDSGEHKTPAQKLASRFLQERQNEENQTRAGTKLPLLTYISTDATYAGVRDALCRQADSSLLIMPDELVELLRGLGKGGQLALKKGQWMSWWSGGELRTLRYGKSIHIPHVSVSIIGGVQPTVFRREVAREHNLEDGLCARFLLTWQPSGAPKKWSSKGIKFITSRAIKGVINRLLDMTTKDYEGGIFHKPDVIPMSEEAEQLWAEFHNEHVFEGHKFDHDLKAAWSKLVAYTARLALIFQYAIWASKPSRDLSGKDLEISPLAMRRAIRTIAWFKKEARRIYQLFAEDDQDSVRRDLIAVIKRNEGRITARQLMRKSWKHQTTESAELALDDLCEAKLAKWVHVPTTKKGGRETRACVLRDHTKKSKS